MKNKKEDIEDLFRDSFENFEAEVNPSTWKNIQTGLKGAGLGALVKALFNKIGSTTLVAVVSSAATVVGTVLVMNWTSKEEKPQAHNTISPAPKTVVEKPSVNEIKDFLDTESGNGAAPAKEAAESGNKFNPGSGNSGNTGSNIVKKDKEQIKQAIKSLSDESVAAISSSVVGGSVPLIVSVSNMGTGKVNKWDFGDGKKEAGVNPVHVYDVPGVYYIVLNSTGTDGKVAIDSVKVEVFGNSSVNVNASSKADFFTPNGDGDRDEFLFNPKDIQEMRVVIANEKGDIVYTIHTQKETMGKWDGRDLKGKPVKEGTYYYVVNAEGKDGKKFERKGKINLTR